MVLEARILKARFWQGSAPSLDWGRIGSWPLPASLACGHTSPISVSIFASPPPLGMRVFSSLCLSLCLSPTRTRVVAVKANLDNSGHAPLLKILNLTTFFGHVRQQSQVPGI